jgi:hypothetical protein
MIQRKQSLFLALAALLAFSTWLFPVSTFVLNGVQYSFMTYGIRSADGAELESAALKVPFHILLTVLGTAFAGSVFLYRDRPRQLRIVRGTYLIALAAVAFLFITDRSVQAFVVSGGGGEHRYGLSFVLPLVALILAFMADRSIRSDEELVRSMDRLR